MASFIPAPGGEDNLEKGERRRRASKESVEEERRERALERPEGTFKRWGRAESDGTLEGRASDVLSLQHHGPDAQDPEGQGEGPNQNRANHFKHGLLLTARNG